MTAGARCTFDELVDARWVERPLQLSAPWVDAHVERLGGWRLAPRLLVDQLASLAEPAPLVLVPRRQVRHLNSQLDHLGETADVLLNPLRATARVDSSLRAGCGSVPHGHQAANVNQLTGTDDIDLVTGMPRYCGVPVTVEPAPRAVGVS